MAIHKAQGQILQAVVDVGWVRLAILYHVLGSGFTERFVCLGLSHETSTASR